MALAIYHDVAVVSVLDGEYVREEAVGRETADEVELRLLELVPEVPLVERPQISELGLAHLVYHLLLESGD